MGKKQKKYNYNWGKTKKNKIINYYNWGKQKIIKNKYNFNWGKTNKQKDHPHGEEMQKGKMIEEALQIALKRR